MYKIVTFSWKANKDVETYIGFYFIFIFGLNTEMFILHSIIYLLSHTTENLF